MIEGHTGFVVDFEVLSNYCMKCARMEADKRKGKTTNEQFEGKQQQHQGNCMSNFQAESGATKLKLPNTFGGDRRGTRCGTLISQGRVILQLTVLLLT